MEARFLELWVVLCACKHEYSCWLHVSPSRWPQTAVAVVMGKITPLRVALCVGMSLIVLQTALLTKTVWFRAPLPTEGGGDSGPGLRRSRSRSSQLHSPSPSALPSDDLPQPVLPVPSAMPRPLPGVDPRRLDLSLMHVET